MSMQYETDPVQIATDLWRITTPVPSRPDHVHAYLARGEGSTWFLLDGGVNTRAAWEPLDAAVQRVAGGWDAVRLQVISHMHLDHVGLLRRSVAASGAPVAMGRLDAERAAHAAREEAEEAEYRTALLRRCGVEHQPHPGWGARRGGGTGESFPEVAHPLPDGIAPLPGFVGWSSVWTPGHTAGHVALFRESDRLLLAGDAILNGITPTIGVNRQRKDPVADYIASLARLAELRPTVSHGGHRDPVGRPGERIEALRAETLAESDRVAGLLTPEPQSTAELVERRYPGRDLPPGPMMLALRETLAHLEHLVASGRAKCVDDGPPERFALP
jgi:glyoxylase-like metal-dependent hydrolase (beta-lactamase superfamily II)